TGKHQQMRRPNRTGTQYDSACGERDRALRADRVDTHRGGPRETYSQCTSLLQQPQVRSSQSRNQKCRAGSDAHTVNDVERNSAYPRNRLRPTIIEVGNPVKPSALGRSNETLSGTSHFVSSTNENGTAIAMGGIIEIQ